MQPMTSTSAAQEIFLSAGLPQSCRVPQGSGVGGLPPDLPLPPPSHGHGGGCVGGPVPGPQGALDSAIADPQLVVGPGCTYLGMESLLRL